MKLFNKIIFISCLLITLRGYSQINQEYCVLLSTVLNHSIFQHLPFTLVDTIYVYEDGEKHFSECDFSNEEKKFYYTWNNYEKWWMKDGNIDSQLIYAVKSIVRTTDTGVIYRTSLLIQISFKQGKQSVVAVDDKCRNKIRYYLLSYKKYISVWIAWKADPNSSINQVVCLTYKKKKNDYILISYGMS